MHFRQNSRSHPRQKNEIKKDNGIKSYNDLSILTRAFGQLATICKRADD